MNDLNFGRRRRRCRMHDNWHSRHLNWKLQFVWNFVWKLQFVWRKIRCKVEHHAVVATDDISIQQYIRTSLEQFINLTSPCLSSDIWHVIHVVLYGHVLLKKDTVKFAPMGHLSATLGRPFFPSIDFDTDRLRAIFESNETEEGLKWVAQSNGQAAP